MKYKLTKIVNIRRIKEIRKEELPKFKGINCRSMIFGGKGGCGHCERCIYYKTHDTRLKTFIVYEDGSEIEIISFDHSPLPKAGDYETYDENGKGHFVSPEEFERDYEKVED